MDLSSDTKAEVEEQFFALLEHGINNTSHVEKTAEKLVPVIQSLDCNSEIVKFTFEFYKNLYPLSTQTLLKHLYTRGALKDGSILSKTCFGPFLSQLLFQSATESAVECAKYCSTLWIDRISNENSSLKTFPNPMYYLNSNSPTKPTGIPFSVLLQFRLLDERQRKLVILDFRKLAKLIPPMFYPRLSVGFFLFLEFYKKESRNQGSCTIQEMCLWAETWYNLVSISLRKDEKLSCCLTLHHVLSGLLVSTNSFEFLSSMPDILSNVLISLEGLAENSSGFTEKWISSLICELDGNTAAKVC